MWATNRRLTLLIALLTLIAGVLPAAIAWVGQLIVDSVVSAAAQHRAEGQAELGPVLSYVGLEGLIVTLLAGVQRSLSACESLLLLCGHYEGIDERVRLAMDWDEISIGDYVVSGGEVAAMVLLDGVGRLRPGVVGDPQSTVTESFEDGLLEAPHYTRPREFRGLAVPDVLLGGDHAAIERWRHEQSRKITEERRSDLLFSSHEKDPRTRSTTTEGKPWIE